MEYNARPHTAYIVQNYFGDVRRSCHNGLASKKPGFKFYRTRLGHAWQTPASLSKPSQDLEKCRFVEIWDMLDQNY